MSNKIPVKRLAQIGLIAKGVVYMLFGVLILIASYGGEQHIRLFGIVKYIISIGPAGRLLVVFLAVGLICYAVWKALQMILNTEELPQSLRGYFVRITWIGPFFFHLGLGGHALVQLVKYLMGSFVYPTQGGIKEFVDLWWGRYVIGFIALTLFVNSISLFYLALTGRYRIMLTGDPEQSSPGLVRLAGFVGYFSYGIALLIISALFALSLYTWNERLAQGSLSMFALLKQHSFGVVMLTIISVGTFCYGLFFALAANFRWREQA